VNIDGATIDSDLFVIGDGDGDNGSDDDDDASVTAETERELGGSNLGAGRVDQIGKIAVGSNRDFLRVHSTSTIDLASFRLTPDTSHQISFYDVQPL
jgi:hypothetical protein